MRRLVLLFLAASCTPPPPEPPPPPELFCPGSPACETNDGELKVGAAWRSITPEGYEIARVSYLSGSPDSCDPTFNGGLCGTLKDNMLDDCGSDALCAGDEGYTAPDADDSQGDGKPDWWLDCGRDRLCPGDDGYTAPDADGTEADGVAQVMWIAGNSESKPMMGIADDISARAIVLEQGDVTVAIVGIDAIGLFIDEEERIQTIVDELIPGAIDMIVMSSSHSHCGPDVLGQWGLIDPYQDLQLGPGRDDLHMELLRHQTAAAIVEAYQDRVPATLHAGQVHTGLPGLLHDGRDPQIVNDVLTAIVARANDDDHVVATLMNWGSHPETLGNRNNFASPDYVATLRSSVEDGLAATSDYPAHEGMGGVAIFTNSTVGGQVGSNGFDIVGRDGTVYPPEKKTYARTHALGERLAEHAFKAIDEAEAMPGARLRFSTQRYQEPVENQAFHVGFFNGWFDRKLLRFNPELPIDESNLPWLETEASLIYVGDVGMLTIPGEAFTESWLGFDDEDSHADPMIKPDNENPPDIEAAPKGDPWRTRVNAKYPVALGLSHDMTGYLVPPYDFQLHPTSPYISDDIPGDHYDETNGVGPQAVPRFEEVATKLFTFEATRAQ